MAKKDGTIFPNLHRERDFVVLVGLAHEQAPEYWIVPTAALDRELRWNHSEWLNAPGRGGRPHKDTGMQRIGSMVHDKEWLAPYRGQWGPILAALGRR